VNVKCLEEVVIGLTLPVELVSVTVPMHVVGTDVRVGPTLVGLMHVITGLVGFMKALRVTIAPWTLSERVVPVALTT
jgi:hypothetical protein